jgi:hypothetical protein
VGAFITSAASLWSSASDLIGGKDDDRKRANEAAYQAALNGDANALLFLKQRTGLYGTAFVPGYGSIGGWATDPAKEDARQKYNAATAALQGQEFVAGAGSLIQGAAQATGHTIVPGTKDNVATFLILGGVAIAALAFHARRKAA